MSIHSNTIISEGQSITSNQTIAGAWFVKSKFALIDVCMELWFRYLKGFSKTRQ
jgi:hypothetical protein